jgi:DNA-binding NtrC family response regulator
VAAPPLAGRPEPAHETLFLDDGGGREHPLSPAATDASASLNLLDDGAHVRPLDEIEAEVIRFALAHYHGQMSEVARRLRIGRSTLYRKLDGLGLAFAGDSGA